MKISEVDRDRLFDLLRTAYIRGGHWMADNAATDEFLAKAANDYCDYVISTISEE